MVIPADDGKLRELILYVANRSMDDPNMGSLKLNKALFYADFGAYLHLGVPITGHRYFKLPQGPAPRHLVEVRDGLLADKSARMVRRDVGADRPLTRLVALREPDLSLFSAEQLAFVDAVLDGLRDSTGTAVSNKTHLLAGWRLAKHQEDIPYETAFLGQATRADLDRGRELAQRYEWA